MKQTATWNKKYYQILEIVRGGYKILLCLFWNGTKNIKTQSIKI